LAQPPTAPRRRLTRSADFDAVYRRGRSRSTRHLVVYLFPRAGADAQPPRVGITVSRAVGSAVVRNRVKRQLREAFVQVDQQAARGADVAIVARPGLDVAIETNGFAWLVGELAGLIAEAPQ
jgi:ribonuclease P protein component